VGAPNEIYGFTTKGAMMQKEQRNPADVGLESSFPNCLNWRGIPIRVRASETGLLSCSRWCRTKSRFTA